MWPKIYKPDLALTLLEPTGKRVEFLRWVCGTLGFADIEFAKERAEEAARKAWRERYDVAVARAVAALPVLCEYCLPLVRVGGAFIAMKGPDAAAERAEAGRAAKTLGGRFGETRLFTLPDGSVRNLIFCEKNIANPDRLPPKRRKNCKKTALNPTQTREIRRTILLETITAPWYAERKRIPRGCLP